MNNNGSVAFRASLVGGGTGIFVGDGNSISQVAITGGAISSVASNTPSINDGGDIAFVGNLNTGASAVFLWSHGSLTTLVDSSGVFSALGHVSLNSRSQIAFAATTTSGGAGIFSGMDPTRDKIVQVGDSLFGSTVTGVNYDPWGSPKVLNDSEGGIQLHVGQWSCGHCGCYADCAGEALKCRDCPSARVQRPKRAAASSVYQEPGDCHPWHLG